MLFGERRRADRTSAVQASILRRGSVAITFEYPERRSILLGRVKREQAPSLLINAKKI
jgi:hypothetical protein